MAGGVLAAPTLAGIAGRAAADGPAVLAGSSPRAAAGFPAALLSQLPTYGWQRCLVDQAAIQFVRLPDGSLEELGSGASATVRGPGTWMRGAITALPQAPACRTPPSR